MAQTDVFEAPRVSYKVTKLESFVRNTGRCTTQLVLRTLTLGGQARASSGRASEATSTACCPNSTGQQLKAFILLF